MYPPSAAIACFDLDGTLTRRDSFRLFVRYLIARHRMGPGDILRAASVFGLRKCRLMSLYEAKAQLLRPLRGLTFHDIYAISLQFWDEVLAGTLRPTVVERLRWHQAQGHLTLVLTSVPDVYLTVVKERLGLDEAIGTPVIFEERRFTGELGPHMYAESKAERLRAMATERGAQLRSVYAYADHHSDLSLLRCSDHPNAVHPTPRLRRQALLGGWTVIDT